MKIADISKWQGDIDWAKASTDLELVIMRASCGLYKDEMIAKNIEGCRKNGIPWGTYHYLMAQSVGQAKQEAEIYFRSHGGVMPSFFVCDVEYGPLLYQNGTKIPMNKNAPVIIGTFVTRLRELGAKRIGFYGGQSIVSGAFDIASNDKTGAMWDFIWIAIYGKNDGTVSKKPTIACDLHQYTSKGTINGIVGNVDMNRLCGDKTLEWFVGDSPTTTAKSLSIGSKGNSVTELQEKLVSLGYDLGTYGTKKNGVDGSFGAKTQAAVRDFQTKHGIHATGVYDSVTKDALAKDINAPVIVYKLVILGDEATMRSIQADHGGEISKVETA